MKWIREWGQHIDFLRTRAEVRGLPTPAWDRRPVLSAVEEHVVECEQFLRRLCGDDPSVDDFIRVLSIKGVPEDERETFMNAICAIREARRRG